MRVHRVTMREIQMSLVTRFETSFGSISERHIVLVEAEVDGTTGWGEVVAGEAPFYAPETTQTAWHILRDFIWPTIKDQEFDGAAGLWCLLGRIRGHNMAKAGLEAALWDAEARAKGLPLWKLIGGTREEIPCGVSIGIKPTLDELAGAVQRALSAGYQRIKIKIKPGWDVEPVRRLREQFPRIRLMVDANSAYRKQDWPLLKQLDAFYLMMIEQPLGWDDLYGHAELQRKLETPICLDECIHSEEHALAAIELGACRILNIKLAAWAAIVWRGASTTSASSAGCRSGAGGCWNPASAGRTTSRSPRCRISRCPATSPPAGVTGTRTSSSRRSR